jgi:TonB family protein
MDVPLLGVVLLLGLGSSGFAQAQTSSSKVSAAPALITHPVQPTTPPITPPAVLHTVDAEYPSEARRKKISGDVWIGLTVGTDGLPSDMHVLQSAGHELDEEAVKAVQQYKFRPAMQAGVPVAVTVKVHVQFKIRRSFW